MMDDKNNFDDDFDTDFDSQFDDNEFDDVPYDEEWDSFDEPVDDAPPVVPQKSKSAAGIGATLFRIFSFLIILLFVGVTGLFVYNKYGKSLFREQVQDVITAEQSQSISDNVALDNTLIPPAESISQDDIVFNDSENDDLPPMPTPMDTQQDSEESIFGDGDTNVQTDTASQAMNDDVLDLTPLPDLENITAEPLPELRVEEEPMPTPTSVKQPVIVPDQPDVIKANDNNEQMNVLAKENKNLTLKLTQAENALNNAQQRISALEEQLQNRPKIVQNTVKSSPTVVKTAKAPAETVTKSVSKPTPKAVNDWVLRSAKPGQAVISRKGSDALRTIDVGAPVSGIGRVQSISNASGRWVVQGTQGTISQ